MNFPTMFRVSSCFPICLENSCFSEKCFSLDFLINYYHEDHIAFCILGYFFEVPKYVPTSPRNPQYGLGLMPWHKASLTAWLRHVPLHSQSERCGDKKGRDSHSPHPIIKFRTPSRRPTMEKKTFFLQRNTMSWQLLRHGVC